MREDRESEDEEDQKGRKRRKQRERKTWALGWIACGDAWDGRGSRYQEVGSSRQEDIGMDPGASHQGDRTVQGTLLVRARSSARYATTSIPVVSFIG